MEYIGISNSLRPSAIRAERVSVRASSTPTREIRGVAVVRIAYRFIHGGSIRLTHCGTMIIHRVCVLPKARDSADSHWAKGMDWIPPRKISAVFAMTGSESPIVAFSHPGNGITWPAIRNSKGIRVIVKKTSTRHPFVPAKIETPGPGPETHQQPYQSSWIIH